MPGRHDLVDAVQEGGVKLYGRGIELGLELLKRPLDRRSPPGQSHYNGRLWRLNAVGHGQRPAGPREKGVASGRTPIQVVRIRLQS
ncbi:MAG: hypothetical protein M3022_02695 [Actinomycetota bacterium]|nr:hypothetical protein [Actinomycetota bacterium]